MSLLGKDFRLLLIGDSTDRQLLSNLCETFRSRVTNYTNGPREFLKQNGVFCRIGSRSAVGQFHNFGVEEPPYWHVWKTHVASGVSNHSFERIRQDCIGFRDVARGDPSVVMVRSASWDYSRWWQDVGMPQTPPDQWCHGGLVDHWRSALADYLQLVRATFPRATLLWRTDAFDHDAYAAHKFHRTSPDCVGAMNQASKHVAHRQGYHVLDVASMLPSPHTAEGIHFTQTRIMQALWALIFSFLKDIDAE